MTPEQEQAVRDLREFVCNSNDGNPSVEADTIMGLLSQTQSALEQAKAELFEFKVQRNVEEIGKSLIPDWETIVEELKTKLEQSQRERDELQAKLKDMENGTFRDNDSLTERCVKLNAKCAKLEAAYAEMRSVLEKRLKIDQGCENGWKQVGEIEIANYYAGAVSEINILLKRTLATTCGQALLDERERHVKALEKLARLGNEPEYGNSVGNMIAREALKEIA